MNKPQLKAVSAAIALALAAGSANAVLERVGPNGTTPSLGGYPTWYQDKTGVTLEFCDPKNAAEVEAGSCLLLTPDVPIVPESFPTSFFDEHFYFAAGANLDTANAGKAMLVLAVEGAFAADVAPGGQIVFSRIRVKLTNAPAAGTYRFIHPYGEEVAVAEAGGTIFMTDDVGINCLPGTFDCALNSRLGPFLLPADLPGGAELAPVSGPVAGKLYIADPARLGPVTGSALPDFIDSTGAQRNHNIFRLEGPEGSVLGVDPATGQPVNWIETTDFSLMGRLFQEAIPSRVDIERANYSNDAANGARVDVFASAFGTMQARLPAQAQLPVLAPQLSFFNAPCNGVPDERGTLHAPFSAPDAGATEFQMFASGAKQWGQAAVTAMPKGICVKDLSARDATGQNVPAWYPQPVTDLVGVDSAYYDPVAGTLTVRAASSDEINPSKLTLAFDDLRADLNNGQIQVSDLPSPPSRVKVLSDRGGEGEAQVRTGLRSAAPTIPTPVAANDTFTLAEDSGANALAVLGNDANVAGATVALGTLPRLGTATVNADGTVSYTPNLNASGSDSFTYTATLNGKTSNVGNVAVTVTPVNDVPLAANDTASAVGNIAVDIDVAANDIDDDGNADIVGVTEVSTPVGNAAQTGATATAVGRKVRFLASQPGTYTFTYKPVDTAGVSSLNPATVTVQVAAAETVAVTRAEYVRSKGRVRAIGTVTPAAGQTVTVKFTNSAGAVLSTAGTATATALGAYDLDAAVPLPANAAFLLVTTNNNTSASLRLTIK